MKNWHFVLLIIACISCSPKMPDDIVPTATMQKMLVDLYYAETYSAMVNDSLHQIRNKNVDSLAVYYKTIQAHYNVSNESFIKSINWYKNNPEQLDTAYASMILHVSEVETKLAKQH